MFFIGFHLYFPVLVLDTVQFSTVCLRFVAKCLSAALWSFTHSCNFHMKFIQGVARRCQKRLLPFRAEQKKCQFAQRTVSSGYSSKRMNG